MAQRRISTGVRILVECRHGDTIAGMTTVRSLRRYFFGLLGAEGFAAFLRFSRKSLCLGTGISAPFGVVCLSIA